MVTSEDAVVCGAVELYCIKHSGVSVMHLALIDISGVDKKIETPVRINALLKQFQENLTITYNLHEGEMWPSQSELSVPLSVCTVCAASCSMLVGSAGRDSRILKC